MKTKKSKGKGQKAKARTPKPKARTAQAKVRSPRSRVQSPKPAAVRELPFDKIQSTVAKLCIDANCLLGDDIVRSFKEGLRIEESPVGKDVLNQLLANQEIARKEMMPICQDTGWAVVWLEVGSNLRVKGGELYDAVQAGVAKGYKEGFLRKSIVEDPLRRKNTGTNTPAIIYTDIVPGEKLKIVVQPKGGGSENMSEVKMLSASDGAEGIKKFVVDRVARSRANPCPPVLVGVGIGGTFEKCAMLAKKALLREVGSHHPDPYYAVMEEDMLGRINKLGIGPQGLGGRVTALAVFIEAFPCHIAAMPCAVNINCHAARHKTAVL
jgi:fumarate hydratase subunit alpha